MNYFTGNLTNRLAYNDLFLTEFAVRRFPLTAIPSNEILSIVESLQNNTSVKTVDLTIPLHPYDRNDTDFTAVESSENIPPCNNKSCEYLLDMLSKNNTIDSLTIRDIRSDDAWKALSKGMKLNSSIRDITLGSNADIWGMELSLTACQSLRDLLSYANNVQCLRLKSFSLLDDNCVKEICIGLEQNTGLNEFVFHSIDCNHFSMIVTSISKSLAPIKKLTFIDCDLRFNMDEEQDDADKAQHPLIQLLTDASGCTLKELRINECVICYDDVVALCCGIKQNSTLQLLNLSGCDLLAEACNPLSNMLRTNETLLHLNLEENIIGDVGASLLITGVKDNISLQTLDLKANHISECGCKCIAESLKESRCYLLSLTLSENPINDCGAEFIGAALAENKSLMSIDLDACMIGDKGIELISNGLVTNSTLKEIILSNNWCKNGSHIADMLSSNNTLQSLDLSSCHMSDGTLEQLLRSLKEGSNKTLKSLYISFNEFANRGATAIGAMLSGSNQLEYINAQYNAFDGTGLRSIITALATNLNLKSFFFWNGQISPDHDITQIDELDHYLILNRAGRRAILINDATGNNAIWANIFYRANSIYGKTAIFHLLREMPIIITKSEANSKCNKEFF
jgi:Ran GTPase-activating protein (RanGAP) involved in mRNA processing and transport